MPKNTKEKNNKAKAAKVNSSKKVEVNKKNSTKNNVANSKKVNSKVVKEEVKVTSKEPSKKVVKKEKKGIFTRTINEITNNLPFAVSLCIILVLIGALLLSLSVKRIPKNSDGEEIIATLNGKKITANELYESLKESYGTDTLINLIDTYIADKEVTVTDEDEEYVQEVVDYYKEYAEYYGTDLATFLASYVGLNGVETEEDFFDYVLADYKKTLAVQQFIGDKASEEELKEYYKENYSDSLTVKHILIEVDSEAEDQEAAEQEAYDKAVSLIKKLNKADSDDLNDTFDELAENNSDDTATYSDGGLIEDFTKNDVVEEFWDASYELEDGELTQEPIKTTYGYHIILKVSSTPVEEYKDIKDDVKAAYAESLLSNDSTLQVTAWDELRSQYKMSIKDDFIKALYKSTVKDATQTDDETTDSETQE